MESVCGNGNLAATMEYHGELGVETCQHSWSTMQELVKVDTLMEYYEKSVMVDSLMEYHEEFVGYLHTRDDVEESAHLWIRGESVSSE